MRIKKGINILCLLLALCAGLVAHAQNQVEFRTPGSDSIKVIDILRNDSYRFDQTDTANPYQTLVGNVAIQILKGVGALYPRGPVPKRKSILREIKFALSAYLEARFQGPISR